MALTALFPSGLTTTTVTAPATSREGVRTVSRTRFSTTTSLPCRSPNHTLAPSCRPVPVSVTRVPPVVGPARGVRLVIDGDSTTGPPSTDGGTGQAATSAVARAPSNGLPHRDETARSLGSAPRSADAGGRRPRCRRGRGWALPVVVRCSGTSGYPFGALAACGSHAWSSPYTQTRATHQPFPAPASASGESAETHRLRTLPLFLDRTRAGANRRGTLHPVSQAAQRASRGFSRRGGSTQCVELVDGFRRGDAR